MRLTATLLLSALFLVPQFTRAIEVSGDQSGVWRPENNPYEVVGEIRVPPESTLVIEPGVIANCEGHHKFIVDSSATLVAVGSSTSPVVGAGLIFGHTFLLRSSDDTAP